MRITAVGLLVAALLAGCGGSDSADEDAPRPSSYVREVDALCRAANPRLAEIQAALTRARDAARAGRASVPGTLDTFATLLRRATTETERFRERLDAIEPPSDRMSFHRAVVDSVDRGLRNLRAQAGAAEAGSTMRLRELSIEGTTINERGKGLFAGHGGFRSCGRSAS